jgi:hypothetical protein
MKCTISFKLGDKTITINDIQSDVDLSGITKLSDLSELLASNLGNSSLAQAVDDINAYHQEKNILATPKYIKDVGVVLATTSPTGTFTSHDLMKDPVYPNRTVAQILNAINTSSYNDSHPAQFANLALTELSPALQETDRIISFVTDKLVDDYNSELKGFFDPSSNRIFIRVADENHLDPSDIESIAHELYHYVAHNKNIQQSFYWSDPNKIDQLLSLTPVNKQVAERLEIIRRALHYGGIEWQASEIIAESLSNKEFNDFLKINGFADFTSNIQLELQKYDYDVNDIMASLPTNSSIVEETRNPDLTPFSRVSEGVDLVPITQVLKGIDKVSHAKVAETIRKEFEAHKKFTPAGSKYSSFDLNYDEAIEVTENNGRTQILSLKQRDLVEVPFFEWDSKKKEFVVKTGKDGGASFRPIIKRFFNKNGDLMITVPASDKSNANSFDLRADEFVLRYRAYLGEMNATVPNAEQIKGFVEKLNDAYDPESDAFFKERQVTIKKGERAGEKIQIFKPTNKNSVSFSFSNYVEKGEFFDQSPIRPLFNNIKKNDVVKVKFSDTEFPAIVSRIFGNSIEAITSKGNIIFVKPKDLVGIIFREDIHPELKELRALASNNAIQRISYETNSNNEKRITKEFLETHKLEYFETKNGIKDYYNLPGDKSKRGYRDTEDYQKGLSNRRNVISKLKLGDLVKAEWHIKENGKDSVTSGWYHVIGTTKNTVYFFTKTGAVFHLNIEEIDPVKTRILGIAYNNEKEAQLVDDFQALHTKSKQLFEDPKGASMAFRIAMKEGQKTTIHQQYFVKQVRNIQDDEMDVPGSSSEQEVAEAYAQVKRGDIVKVRKTNMKDEEYTQWRVVTGKDADGRAITAAFSNAYTVNYEFGSSYTSNAGYRVYAINENDVVAVGLRVDGDENLEIEGHDEIRLQIEEFKKKLDTFNTPKLISNLISGKEVSVDLLKFYEPVEAVHVRRGEKDTWVINVKDTDVRLATNDKKYFLKEKNKKKTFLLSEGKFHYEYVWYPKEIKKGVIHNALKPGDILTEKYIGRDGQAKYIDSIVLNVFPTGVTVYKYLYDEESGTFQAQQNTIFKKKKEDTDFPSLQQVALAKSGRGMKGARDVRNNILKSKKVVASVASTNFAKSRDSREKIIAMVDRIKSLYNVKIEVLTSSELEETMGEEVKNASAFRGFIYNGVIYINSDIASTAEPLHEMGHLILGIMQSENPDLYRSMMSKLQGHVDYNLIAEDYPELEGDALNTEVFVTLFGEYSRSKDKGFFSKIINFVKGIFSRIFDNKGIFQMTDDDFANMSLDQLFIRFGDSLMNKKFNYALTQFSAAVSKKIEALKSKFMDENKLTTTCTN